MESIGEPEELLEISNLSGLSDAQTESIKPTSNVP